MKIDPGMVVVIAAALVFYLRLILLQRQRLKLNAAERVLAASRKSGGKGKTKTAPASPPPARYSNLTNNPVHWAIAGCGALAILAGVLLNAGILPLPTLQTYWWAPTALGILAFSWVFQP
jgi:hypothetical protein